jgi:AcrR family transcriptional regulator
MNQAEPSPARYHHGDLREALIAAGLELLGDDSPAALSLRAVARRVGVSHAAAYRHFADKADLLAAIAEQGFVLLSELMAAEVAAAGVDHAARFVACARAYMRFAQAHPRHFRVMFSGWADDRARRPALSAAADRSHAVLLDVVRSGQAAGVIVAGEPRIIALSAWASIHGLAALLLERQLLEPPAVPLDGERLARRMALLLFNGLRDRMDG